jgi:hypothetical protein
MKNPVSAKWTNSVLPHGPLRLIAPGVWEITGTTPRGPVARNMVVHVLKDGTLWLHSVIALNEKTMEELERLGRPSVMVVPNPIHRMDAAVYKERFSDIQVVCPEAVRAKVEEVVKVDATCEQVLPGLGIECLTPGGLKPFELAYLLPTPDGKVLVFTDALMNLGKMPGWQGFVLSLVGSSGFFGITFVGKILLMRDRAALAAWLGKLASIPSLRAICVAHGDAITSEPHAALRSARQRLVKD